MYEQLTLHQLTNLTVFRICGILIWVRIRIRSLLFLTVAFKMPPKMSFFCIFLAVGTFFKDNMSLISHKTAEIMVLLVDERIRIQIRIRIRTNNTDTNRNPRGQKTYSSYGSGFGTLVKFLNFGFIWPVAQSENVHTGVQLQVLDEKLATAVHEAPDLENVTASMETK
jgi:hypothetical protein